MLEKKVEERLRKGVAARGGICWKWTSPGKAGVPDRIVVTKGPVICFVELKTEAGKLTPLQKAAQYALSSLGANVFTLYGPADVDRFLASLDLL